jgi:3-oxoacyl-[acyl-carrier-protein] synthase-1
MQALVLSHLSVVNSLGAGLAATHAALRERRSGLQPCSFETVTLPTYVGEVAGVDQVRIRAI